MASRDHTAPPERCDTHQLAIVAAPHFLGLLRRNLDTQTRALVTLEVDQEATVQAALVALRASLP